MVRARSLALTFALALAACRGVEEPSLAPSWGPEAAQRPLTHSDCVRLAATWAPNAAAWEARHAAAQAALSQAGKLANPHLEASWEDFRLVEPTDVPVQTTLSLFVALEDLASRGARKAAAAHELAAEESDLRAELARLERDVRGAYDDLVSARDAAALADDGVELAGAQRDAAARFVESGERPGIERERADAELAQARADARAAHDAARARELELAFALGFERPTSLGLAEGLTGSDGETAAPPALEDLLAEAAGARPELVAAAERYAAERERCRLAADRVRFLPTVGFGPRLESGEVRGVASLDVELPLFDSGATAARAQDAALLAAAAELRRSAHEVGAQVCLAAAHAAAARAYLDDHARDLAARRAKLRRDTERLFEAGEASYDELVLARRDELDARRGLLAAEREAAGARLELAHALGRLGRDELPGS